MNATPPSPPGPTLVRLVFWLTPPAAPQWTSTYQDDILPLIQKHGFGPAAARPHPLSQDAFCRLFTCENATVAVQSIDALQRDPTWQELLHRLGRRFAADGAPLSYGIGIYRTRAGTGKTHLAGTGQRQGKWHTFNGQDGLPSTTVRALLPDSRGNLWLATDGAGVCRFDGAHFFSFSREDGLAGDMVLSIAEDGRGHLYFGTSDGGISRYDGTEFFNFSVADGLDGQAISRLVVDGEDRLWCNTPSGVYRLERTAFKRVALLAEIGDMMACAVLRDQDGAIWHTVEEGWTRHEGGGTVRLEPVLPPSKAARSILAQDSGGGLWLKQWDIQADRHQVFRFDGERAVQVDELDRVPVNSMLADGRGHLWFGSSTRGLRRCADGRWDTFTVRDGLANDQILCMAEDRQGVVWIGTLGGGFSRYDTALETFTVENGLSSDGIMCITADRQGDLWFGTWEGACCLEGQSFNPLEPLAGKNVWALQRDAAGHLWFGALDHAGRRSVGRYDGSEVVFWSAAEGLRSPFVSCLAEDGQGGMLCGSAAGIDRIDGGRVSPLEAGGIPLDFAKALLIDRRGCLWSGHGLGASRLYRIEAGKAEIVAQGEDELGQGVWALYEDRRGHVWIGTLGKGVYRYDGTGLTRFSAADGLAHDWVHAIMEDADGHMWFGTFGGGVSLFDGRVFQTLSQRDGLPHDTVQSLFEDRGGAVWIGTEGGLARYRPQRLPPVVGVTDVVAGRHHGAPPNLQLNLPQELVAFEVQGGSFTTRPDSLAYVYRLRGLHDDWRAIYSRRIEYQDLAAGAYTFEVRAVDRDLNYSAVASLEVSVEPDAFLEGVAGLLAGSAEEFIGASRPVLQVRAQLEQVAATDWTVLLRGETGTGKGIAARHLHRSSPRRDCAMVAVNCSAIPEGLVESELFGHERGAFTGAVSRQLGKVELAEGGTLFLDEIGDMPLAAQAKLLRFLEDRSFERLGGKETLQARVRIVAATNRRLEEAVAAGAFRQDLFYRLGVFVVELPPLRQHLEDIPLLAAHFTRRFARHLNRPVPSLGDQAIAYLQSLSWPGNVRELEHLIQRAVLVCGDIVSVGDLAPGDRTKTPPEGDLVPLAEYDLRRAEEDKEYIRRALAATGGVVYGENGAARLLGVHPEKLRARMKKLGLLTFRKRSRG